MDRRRLLVGGLASLGVLACGGRARSAEARPPMPTPAPGTASATVTLTDDQWREVLTAEEFHVLREAGTERAFTGDLWDHHGDGVYVCAGCGLPLFDSAAKFDSGTGWPSYTAPVAAGRVADKVDRSYGMTRVENVCARCGGHLGHVFDDGPPPTGKRFCINSVSLDFVPRADVAKLGAPPVVRLGGWEG